MTLKISDVFPAVGKPTITYVERDAGANEKKLTSGLENAGQICLVTGPSKTGKTCLYKSILPKIKKTELVIRCSGNMTAEQFWAYALEDLNFSQLAETAETWGINIKTEIGAKGEAGWIWLAKAMMSIGLSVAGNNDYTIKNQIVRSKLSAKHLIPLLSKMPVQLIVEDFHYLKPEVKREVFQQWKTFVDRGVSVVVVSTTHHAVDIARANPDLTGRTRLIDVGKWQEADLAEIPERGFRHLGIKIGTHQNSRIARESVGLPIIAQQLCQHIASERDLSPGSHQKGTSIQVAEIDSALEHVCDTLYTNHKSDYDRLAAGPRRGARKHATYEKILASFALDPLQFSLSQHELMQRISNISLESEPQIPQASITSALNALAKFQEKNELSLLDWHESERTLYIIEPSFLFYLRLKLKSTQSGENIIEKIKNLLTQMSKLSNESGLKLEFRKIESN